MQLRLLQYFVALAKEGHFARAAQSCAVTQPTLSAGIAALEAQLGKRLVQRERRFMSLTAEGLAVLPWAQRIVADLEALGQSLHELDGPLSGTVRLGAIPASLPATGALVRAIAGAHPGLTVSIRSLTSRDVERGLAAFELDAGLTYLDHEPPAQTLGVPLYAETYMLVTRADARLATLPAARWQDAVAEPLCLLNRSMQNRRILDAHLAAIGLAATPRVEADSYITLLAMVRAGGVATIIPDSYAGLVVGLDWVRVVPLADPFPATRVGLVVLERNPLGPLASALLSLAKRIASDREFLSSMRLGDLILDQDAGLSAL